jgi:hypothetical protein
VFVNLHDNSATDDAELSVPFAQVVDGMHVADAWYDSYGEAAGGRIRAGSRTRSSSAATAACAQPSRARLHQNRDHRPRRPSG